MNHDFPYSKFESQLYQIYRFFLFRRHLKRLCKETFISPYSRLQNMKCISIGDRSHIGRVTLVQAVIQYLSVTFTPALTIEDDVCIGNHCTISGATEITIGAGTTIGGYCFLEGGRHGYEDITQGVLTQQLMIGSLKIGPRVWIGYGSYIAAAGHLEIGEHDMVGTNSVVKKSIPAFTMVAGAPAKPIKRYDFEQKKGFEYHDSEAR